MPYKVIAECIDARSGKRYFPGEDFPAPDKDQVERLVKARCIEEVSAAEAKRLAKDAADRAKAEAEEARKARVAALEAMTDEQLAEQAKERGVDISKATDRAAVLALLAG